MARVWPGSESAETRAERNTLSTEKCDQTVFDKGEFIGVFDISKEQAEDLCKHETERTGRKHDWHYFAGRVRVLALPA